jgi:hypothetical protein
MFSYGFQCNCMAIDFNGTKQLNYNLWCKCADLGHTL